MGDIVPPGAGRLGSCGLDRLDPVRAVAHVDADGGGRLVDPGGAEARRHGEGGPGDDGPGRPVLSGGWLRWPSAVAACGGRVRRLSAVAECAGRLRAGTGEGAGPLGQLHRAVVDLPGPVVVGCGAVLHGGRPSRRSRASVAAAVDRPGAGAAGAGCVDATVGTGVVGARTAVEARERRVWRRWAGRWVREWWVGAGVVGGVVGGFGRRRTRGSGCDAGGGWGWSDEAPEVVGGAVVVVQHDLCAAGGGGVG
ncbi:hypothetical protein B0I31_11692 [Saccharothrix carnea]|uniref:Uncharacterized protein n=1 Tax=Saccharothrix carnea TaxID=1280637 RepID=A0A2P8I0L6_SACCR|nr:hypothetical protein B0I31_11692 [Saccharothrix carnea]